MAGARPHLIVAMKMPKPGDCMLLHVSLSVCMSTVVAFMN
jgi:hypothetical protein